MDLNNKKVLQVGLGVLGGGVATARFLVEQGALLTVTDMKSAEYLSISLEKLADLKDKINFVLGEHREADFLENEIIVLNPDVSPSNPLVQLAIQAGKRIETELTLFFRYAKYKSIIGITGTRGKTTTTLWTGHILSGAFEDVRVIGNDPNRPFLTEINHCTSATTVVLEVPSFQLETFGWSSFAPNVALITNLYQDHLSRHKTMAEYALAKANIFKHQNKDDVLILNKDNEWTQFFLAQKPQAKIIFTTDNMIWLPAEITDFKQEWGEHNLHNLFAATAVALAMGMLVETIKKQVFTLPSARFREEKVFQNEKITIYNDTTSTSPEATLAAVERFATTSSRLVLIAGGTDRELDFQNWGSRMKNYLNKIDLILLEGSATEKMKVSLRAQGYLEYRSLSECFKMALQKAKETNDKAIILFSPGAKSFEKFKNEFDRGEQFNALVEEYKSNGSL